MSEFLASDFVTLSNDNIQINCVRMIFKPNELNLVSTDSYRLLYLKVQLVMLVQY